MTVNPGALRSESFAEIGLMIRRDAKVILQEWSERAAVEQPQAHRAHHQMLLDHLPLFLDELGSSLAKSGDDAVAQHWRPAFQHGVQRWDAGWSLTELVRDYQMLRLVLIDCLQSALHRPLGSREHQALGLALDEAIAVSVGAFVDHQAEHARREDKERADRAQQTAELLRRHAEQLEEAHRSKDAFLALLSHELRNPLAPLSNALHVLSLDPSREALEWARGLMDRQIRVLTRLVDDLLDVSRIARGKMTVRRERLDLAQVVRDTTEDRRASFQEAGLDLELETPSHPVWVEGEATRLTQVLGNLLHNAQKFTGPGGRVRVELSVKDSQAEIAVSDTGAGIAPQLLPRVFEAFTQGDRDPDRRTGGLGLGLALVKGLVELHGGTAMVSSEGLGKGTLVHLTLPLTDSRA
jgi:signal transduction histidine kinase